MIGHRSETRRSIELLRESDKDLSNGKAGGTAAVRGAPEPPILG